MILNEVCSGSTCERYRTSDVWKSIKHWIIEAVQSSTRSYGGRIGSASANLINFACNVLKSEDSKAIQQPSYWLHYDTIMWHIRWSEYSTETLNLILTANSNLLSKMRTNFLRLSSLCGRERNGTNIIVQNAHKLFCACLLFVARNQCYFIAIKYIVGLMCIVIYCRCLTNVYLKYDRFLEHWWWLWGRHWKATDEEVWTDDIMGMMDPVTFKAPVYLKYDRRFWSTDDDFEGRHWKADEEACSCSTLNNMVNYKFIISHVAVIVPWWAFIYRFEMGCKFALIPSMF